MNNNNYSLLWYDRQDCGVQQARGGLAAWARWQVSEAVLLLLRCKLSPGPPAAACSRSPQCVGLLAPCLPLHHHMSDRPQPAHCLKRLMTCKQLQRHLELRMTAGYLRSKTTIALRSSCQYIHCTSLVRASSQFLSSGSEVTRRLLAMHAYRNSVRG